MTLEFTKPDTGWFTDANGYTCVVIDGVIVASYHENHHAAVKAIKEAIAHIKTLETA